MNFWPGLWKGVFLFGVASFTLVSIWVAVAGAGDVRRMFRKLSKGRKS